MSALFGTTFARSAIFPASHIDIMSESEADKKRNKLGYQRISVACGHCRRRKIRCVMADADPQGRCSNCIRLGKQCVFYPVDQTGPSESKAASTSSKKASAASNISLAASHPPPHELTAGRSAESSTFPVVPSIPSNVPQGYPVAYEGAFQGQGAEYGHRPQEYPRQWSIPGDLSPSTQAAMAGPVGGFVAPRGNIPAYSQFAASDSIHSTPTDTRSYSFPTPDDERQWHVYHQQQHPHPPPPPTQQEQEQQHQQHQSPSHPQQGRAMSYGNFEAMQTTYAQVSMVYAGAGAPMQNMGALPYGLPHLDMQAAQMHQMSGPRSAPANVPMVQQFSQDMPFAFQPGVVFSQALGQQGFYAPFGQGAGEGDSSSPRRTQR